MAKKKIEKYCLLWWVKVITGQINVPDYELLNNINKYDIFIINRLFSHVSKLQSLTEKCNREGFTKWMHFNAIRSACKHKNIQGFVKLDWQQLKSSLLNKQPDIKKLMDYFQINKKTAQEYLKLISKEEMQEIRDYYKLIEDSTKISKTKLSK